jgi:hypothetical protein
VNRTTHSEETNDVKNKKNNRCHWYINLMRPYPKCGHNPFVGERVFCLLDGSNEQAVNYGDRKMDRHHPSPYRTRLRDSGLAGRLRHCLVMQIRKQRHFHGPPAAEAVISGHTSLLRPAGAALGIRQYKNEDNGFIDAVQFDPYPFGAGRACAAGR